MTIRTIHSDASPVNSNITPIRPNLPWFKCPTEVLSMKQAMYEQENLQSSDLLLLNYIIDRVMMWGEDTVDLSAFKQGQSKWISKKQTYRVLQKLSESDIIRHTKNHVYELNKDISAWGKLCHHDPDLGHHDTNSESTPYIIKKEDILSKSAIVDESDSKGASTNVTIPDISKLRLVKTSWWKDQFDEFYKLYPRKVSKGAAIKAWNSASCFPTKDRNQETLDCVLAGLKRSLPEFQKRKKEFIPHPSTWLRAMSWLDEETDDGAGQKESGPKLLW